MAIEDKYQLELDPAELASPDTVIVRWAASGLVSVLGDPVGPKDMKHPWAGGATAPDAWADKVRSVLQEIEAKNVGVMLLSALPSSGAWVRVRPYWHTPLIAWEPALMGHLRNPCNAQTLTILEKTSDSAGNPTRIYRSLVRISPERYEGQSPCSHRPKGQDALTEGHEVLFHELVHALRMVSQHRDETKLGGGLGDFENVEEFIAVVVTNVYASANGKTILRAGERDHRSLPLEFMDSFKFFEMGTMTFPIIKQFVADNTDFCKQLKLADAKHNPIWAFSVDPDKALRCSQSAKARARDAH